MGKELYISDIRKIVRSIFETYNIDFRNYALAAFKQRLEKVISLHSFRDANELIRRIEKDKNFFEIFLKEISVPVTEMFRDPFLWKKLSNSILPSTTANTNINIWFPCCSSGEDIFSLAILLKESNLSEKVKIIASSISKKNIEHIKKGIYNLKKINLSTDNYKNFNGKSQLPNYYIITDNKAYIDTSLIKNVDFINNSLFQDESPKNIKIIMFRNKMIYYNKTLQAKAVKILYESLLPDGYLISGIKEAIPTSRDSKFVLVDEYNKIYKKV